MTNTKKMNEEEMLTLKAVLLYILKCSSEMDKSVYFVAKVAFLAQQKHLSKYLCPLFEDKIVALRFGPVPSNLYDALKIARGDEKARLYHKDDNLHLVYNSISFCDESFSANEEPDMDFLSSAAIECIDEALSIVSKMSFNEIVAATHTNEWQRAFNDTKNKTMNILEIAKDGGADENSLFYLKENMELDTLLM